MLFGNTVALGPIFPVDLERLFRWMDNADDARLNEPYRPLNWQHQESFWLNADQDASRVFFAIRVQDAPHIVGFIQIHKIHAIHRSALIGIRIGEVEDRGKGLAADAMAIAIEYCWRDLNLSRLELTVFAHNEPARRLYHRLGFVEEGISRNALFMGGNWIDVVNMALMRPDRVAPEG